MIELYKKENGKKVKITELNQTKPFFISLDEEDNLLNISITEKENNDSIDIIGIDYFDDSNKTKAEEIIEKIVLPYMYSGKSNELNFISTGKNAISYLILESILKSNLEKMGYSNNQINEIISKISYVSLLSNVDTSEIKASSIIFTDVNNKDTETEFTNDYKEFLKAKEEDKIVDHYGSTNSIIYIFKGTGKNEIEDYLKEPGFKAAISYILESTAKNQDKDYDSIIEVLRNTQTEDFTKYNFSYTKPKSDIDIAVEATNDIVKMYKDEEKLRKERENQINKLIACIKEYSSDTTYNQILMASGIYEFEDPNYLNADSDRTIRKYYEEIMFSSNEDEKKNTK